MPGAQLGVQFVGDFGPVRIVTDGFAQEGRLRWRPEGGFVQQDVAGQRAVAFDELRNGRFIVGLAELGEKRGQVVYGSFHDAFLLCPHGNVADYGAKVGVRAGAEVRDPFRGTSVFLVANYRFDFRGTGR